jgi:Zn ribbon nucleic-acid-binding protein
MSAKTADLESYKTIKVPLWVYKNAKEVELALMKKGLEHVPWQVLEPLACPICKSELEPFHASKKETDYLRCTHCGYTQQRFAEDEKSGEYVMGTAIGMGLIYFLNMIFGSSVQANE